MLPNLFIIGAPKCGTTSLHNYLAAHPEIHMSPLKEPQFFADADPRFPFRRRRVTDRDEYEALFESDAPRRGESSPNYSQYPLRLNVPRRIHELIPDAQLIYIVRDPIERIVSDYVMRVALKGERRPFAEAIGDDLMDPFNTYTCASRYATQLEQFLKVFPDDQILVVDRSELKKDRSAALREVFRFLDVSPDFNSPAFATEANVGGEHRRLPTVYVAARRSQVKKFVDALPAPLTRPMLAGMRRVIAIRHIDRPNIDEETRTRLVSAFGEEVRQLRALTGKKFASWSL